MQDTPPGNNHSVPSEKTSTIQQLAAGMAHEIWNPLMVVKTMVFAMRADLPPEDPRGADFDIVDQGIDRMERSVQQFLDYTWPPDPIFAPVRLDRIVTNALDQLTRKAQSQGVHIETHVDLDIILLADQRQIEQVFVNLGLNALQAMPTGGTLRIEAKTDQVFINLALNALPTTVPRARPQLVTRAIKSEDVDKERNADKEQSGVEVAVADTGEGIEQDLIKRIFEPFAIEGKAEAGLGLAIVQQIVERHGGQIAAHNSPEGGATFTLILPRMDDENTKNMET